MKNDQQRPHRSRCKGQRFMVEQMFFVTEDTYYIAEKFEIKINTNNCVRKVLSAKRK